MGSKIISHKIGRVEFKTQQTVTVGSITPAADQRKGVESRVHRDRENERSALNSKQTLSLIVVTVKFKLPGLRNHR